MGMFDSLYDENGHDWQTKAFDCMLDVYRVGDRIPDDFAPEMTYQVEILGDPVEDHYVRSFATVKDGVLCYVNVERDPALPRLDYTGAFWAAAPSGEAGTQ